MIIIDEGTNKLKIDTVHIFISVDDAGNEGVCAFLNPDNGMFMPMVCADEERLEQLRPIAERLAKEGRQKIKLIKLSERSEVEEINP